MCAAALLLRRARCAPGGALARQLCAVGAELREAPLEACVAHGLRGAAAVPAAALARALHAVAAAWAPSAMPSSAPRGQSQLQIRGALLGGHLLCKGRV
jgi:hypothetical protein